MCSECNFSLTNEDPNIFVIANYSQMNVRIYLVVKIEYIYIWIYSLASNNLNECPNIFKRRKKSWMNVRMYSVWKNSRIFGRMNIFVNKYSNIFEYPNICDTLIYYLSMLQFTWLDDGKEGVIRPDSLIFSLTRPSGQLR